jgi:adenylate cyclase
VSEPTTQLPRLDAAVERSAHERLRELTRTAQALVNALQAQKEALRPRGMNLPPNALETAQLAALRLEALLNGLPERQLELRQLRALARTTALITSTLDVDRVLEQVMDTVIQLTGAERGYLMLRDQATGALEFRTARGIDREQLSRSDFIISNTIVNEVATTGQPVLTDNAGDDPRYRGHDSIVGFQLRSILAVPLTVAEATIGVVYCDNRAMVGLFREHEMNLLRAFADQAAVAIQNARLFEAARARLAEITEMRDLMDNIFTSIASGLIALDAHDAITAFNPAAEQLTGWAAPDVLGQPLHLALPALGSLLAEPIARVRGSGALEQIDAEFLRDDKVPSRRHWSIVLTPLQEAAGAPAAQGVVLLLDDLTDQREREAQLAQVRRYLPPALVENIRSEDLAALGGQEREISVLCADVRGFTSFGEKLEPEALMEIINRYLSVASDTIGAYQGVVDKYIGDAVTGLFNTQLNPQADHALRALSAAVRLRAAVEVLNAAMPADQQLRFGIGIHSGLAVLGNVGSSDRREFAALGSAMEIGKLLQENAHRGEIMLSPATYALLGDYVICEAQTPRKTRSHVDLAIMYRVDGIRAGAALLEPAQL